MNPARGLADLVFPRGCGLCGAVTAGEDERYLCWDCRAQMPVIREPFCRICGMPVAGSIDHAYTCHQCTERPPAFDGARSAARYDGPVRDAVHAFKYYQALWLEDDLAALMAATGRVLFHLEEIDAVSAVPLFARRRRERGYNQSELLGRALARRLDLPFLDRVLRRTRDTGIQARLNSKQRISNVQGAFEVSKKANINDLKILLIDDVMTTGATVSECARELKGAGAASVHVFTLARG